MKITEVAVDVLEVPVERPYMAGGRTVDANWHVTARIRTGDGIEGFGYIVKLGPQLIRAVHRATAELGQDLIGMDLLDVEAAWRQLNANAKWVGPGGLVHWAIAPLDIAMWDAAGKALGQPLYRLLGGNRDHVSAYASDGMWYSLTLDELAETSRQHAAAGFKGIKLRLGKTPSAAEQVERARTAGAAAGAGVSVMVDATESWDLPHARVVGHALQDAGVTWLEDPLHHEDVAGLATLASALRIPVTGGENLYTLAQFRESFAARALDIAILDLARVGGITPWRKIAALAEAHRVQVCGHVIPEVHVHLLAAVPNGHMVEYMPRSGAILRNQPTPENGVLKAPDAPGHGLELDQSAFERYRVT